MVSITCDNCGAEKPERLPAATEWILGYDLETETPNSVQRAIRLLDHWDDRRVLEFGAIHLCSIQCRDEYLKQSAARMSARPSEKHPSICRRPRLGPRRVWPPGVNSKM